jgi:putative ABC transport system permease protein
MGAIGLQISLATRYLWGRKLRTVLTTLAVALGVMLLFGLNGMLPAMFDALQSTLLSGAAQVDLTVTSVSQGTFEAGVVEDVARADGVKVATPILRRGIGIPKGAYGDVTALTVVGLDPRTVQKVRRFRLSEGRFLLPRDGDVVVLPKDIADRMGVRLGSDVSLPSVAGTTDFRVVGLLEAGVAGGAGEGYMPLGAAQTLLGERGRISEIEAAFEPGVDRAAVERRVRTYVGEDYSVGALQATSTLFANVGIAQLIMNLFGVFALVMAGFIILNTFRTMVAERRRDIGMLRAVGASRGTILGMFLAESVLQGALGTAAGLVAGYGLAAGVLALMEPLLKAFMQLEVGPPLITPGIWIASIALGMGVTILSALIPAAAASRITPLEAMRPQMGEVYEKAMGRRAWIGAAVLAIAIAALSTGNVGTVALSAVLFLVGITLVTPAIVKPVTDVFGELIALVFTRTGGLARANLQRNPGRAAATASAVMVSIAVVVAVLSAIISILQGFWGYLDKSLGADFLIVPQSLLLASGNIGADERLVGGIRRAQGIQDVATLRLGSGKLGDTAMQVIGIDPEDYPKVATFEFSGGSSEADIGRLAQSGTVMVNQIFSSQNGVAKGDRLTVETPTGRKTYRVVGVGNDYLNAKLSTAYTSQETLGTDFNSTTDLLVLANIAPGYDLATVRRSLTRVLERYPQFTLWDSVTFKQNQIETVDAAMAFYYILIGSMAIPTFLALLNTLAISVLARTREIGMLRAVGSTRKQIRRMVLAESLLLAMLGMAIGIIGGVWLGYAMWRAYSTIYALPYSFPTAGILVAIAAGLIFAVLAALIPARQATHMDVVQALRWE